MQVDSTFIAYTSQFLYTLKLFFGKGRNKMTYAGVQMFMAKLKQLINCNDNPMINRPEILKERPKFQRLHDEIGFMIKTFLNDGEKDLHELENDMNLKERFRDAVEEAQDIVDLFLSFAQIRVNGHILKINVFPSVLELSDVTFSIKSIKSIYMIMVIDKMKKDLSERKKTQFVSAAGTSCTRKALGSKKAWDDIVVGLDYDSELIRDKLVEDQKQLDVSIMIMVIEKMKKDLSERKKTQFVSAAGTSCTRKALGSKKAWDDIVVGLDYDSELIRDKLVEDQKQLDVVSIVGMGGLGKTTLATKIFNDSFVVYHFHICAWVTISQTYDKRDVLFQILASMGVDQLDLEKSSDSRLREMLHKNLMGKRYLIVVDDIWSIKAWDKLKLFFPHDNTGSRILLVSRLTEVALHAKLHGFIHHLKLLTHQESWKLLCEKVFHGEECPECLIEPGMLIAKSCHGLPLAVVVIAGVLAKEERSNHMWVKIARSVSSYIVSERNGCLDTLALSYHHLPHHLRECFLYLGGFEEDYKFHVQKLIWLWVAEGFILQAGNRSLEKIAEGYLMDLVERNLLIVAKRKSNGDVKTCKLHDLVRELCLKKAKEEKLCVKLHSPNHHFDCKLITRASVVCLSPVERRVFTYTRFHRTISHALKTPYIRSLLCFNTHTDFVYDTVGYLRAFALLTVLDIQNSVTADFLKVIASLLHLRYLAIQYRSGLLDSICCNLWNIQTIIVKAMNYERVELSENISNLVNLRHLWSNVEFYLPFIAKPINLKTISYVVLADLAEVSLKCFPRIEKLACTLSLDEEVDFKSLPYLERLKVTGLGRRRQSFEQQFPKTEPNFIFHSTLKKLTLVRCHLPWSDMSIIQSLPNLEVLKLLDNAFDGTQWKTCDEQFQSLKFLRLELLNIEHWEASSINFPLLKQLQIMKCYGLTEIPLEIGEIPTLELIKIEGIRGRSIVESMERIQAEQHSVGNYELQINVDGMDLSFYLSECLDSF